jgi:hypothetical protein
MSPALQPLHSVPAGCCRFPIIVHLYRTHAMSKNRDNARMLIVFSNVENYMDEVHKLSADWARLP